MESWGHEQLLSEQFCIMQKYGEESMRLLEQQCLCKKNQDSAQIKW